MARCYPQPNYCSPDDFLHKICLNRCCCFSTFSSPPISPSIHPVIVVILVSIFKLLLQLLIVVLVAIEHFGRIACFLVQFYYDDLPRQSCYTLHLPPLVHRHTIRAVGPTLKSAPLQFRVQRPVISPSNFLQFHPVFKWNQCEPFLRLKKSNPLRFVKIN